jgi:hypothetical protein
VTDGGAFEIDTLTNDGTMNVTGAVTLNAANVAGSGTVNFTDVTLAAGNVYEDTASAIVYNFAGTNTVAADLNFGTTVNQTGKLDIVAGAVFEADTITADGFVNVVAGTVDADVIDVTGADAKLRIHGNGTVNADIQIGSGTEAGLLDFMNGTVTGTPGLMTIKSCSAIYASGRSPRRSVQRGASSSSAPANASSAFESLSVTCAPLRKSSCAAAIPLSPPRRSRSGSTPQDRFSSSALRARVSAATPKWALRRCGNTAH